MPVVMVVGILCVVMRGFCLVVDPEPAQELLRGLAQQAEEHEADEGGEG
jgi:hypothetical protein